MNDLNSEFESIEVDSTDDNCSDDSHVVDSTLGVRDSCEPQTDLALVDEHPPEHLLNRLRIVLWGPHQVYVARVLLGALILMAIFFSFRWYNENGLVDIDQADSIRAEFKVDINSAELGEIVVLPGIGVKLAQAIIDHRVTEGEFESLDELCAVPGIGEKTLESLTPYLLPIKPMGVAN